MGSSLSVILVEVQTEAVYVLYRVSNVAFGCKVDVASELDDVL